MCPLRVEETRGRAWPLRPTRRRTALEGPREKRLIRGVLAWVRAGMAGVRFDVGAGV